MDGSVSKRFRKRPSSVSGTPSIASSVPHSPSSSSGFEMAAAMRAMSASIGMGIAGSSTGALKGHGHSTSESYGASLGEELSRSASRMPSPVGILMNHNRQNGTSSPPSPMYAHSSSSEDSLTLPRAMSATDMVHLVPTRSSDSISEIFSQANAAALQPPAAAHSRRGRSTSRETGDESASGSKPKLTRDASKTTIRFAPFPEIRPRSYSTGRNVFLETADVTDRLDELNPRKWVRRDQNDNLVGSSAVGDTDDEDSSSPTRSMFGAWASDLASATMARGDTDRTSTSSTPTVTADSKGHRSESKGRSSSRSDSKNRGSSKERKEDHHEESYTSKILRPLSFGLVKKKTGRPSTATDSLSRTTTNDSISQQRPTGQGVPMRKSRTWEPPGEAPVARRANYPPVAQRSRKNRVHVPAPPDPKFVEWGYAKEGGGGGGGLGSVRKGPVNADAEEDGSGMAWVKMRREQKEVERKEKERLAEEAAETLRLELEEGDVGSGDDLDATRGSPLLTITEASSGTTTPMSASLLGTPRPSLHLDTGVASPPPAILATPTIVPPSPDLFGTAFVPDTIDESEDVVESNIKASNRLSVGSFTGNTTYGTDGEESDDGGRSNADDDSDLDEDELAAEEALVQEARSKACGTASEKFQDSTHQTRVLNLEAASPGGAK